MRRVLIVDDERNVHYSFRRALEGAFEVSSAHDAEQALALLATDSPDAVLLDVKLPRVGGLEALEQIRDRYPDLPVIVMTAYGTVETAIRSTALAARDYLLKPVDVPSLKKLLNEILPQSARPSEVLPVPSADIRMVGKSRAMHDLFKLIGRAAAADTTVLVTGESGTGKELVARAIHEHGKRKGGAFVAINCAAIPENLLESELFGHERGAFTGADAMRAGKFELAHRGTLILDEIGEMAPTLQAKLLRVLQAREVTRLGGSSPVRLDVRLIVLTNADLEAKVAVGSFREDLYYRLNVLRIQVPALRERDDDVLLLAAHFLARDRTRLKRSINGFASEAEELLLTHSWPGNVRELENVVQQACLKAKGDRITAADLSLRPSSRRGSADPAAVLADALVEFLRAFPGEGYERVERMVVEHALDATRGNQVQAARLLGVTRNVIRNRMAKHHVGTGRAPLERSAPVPVDDTTGS
ncbi:MAG TPA: sigma-54 dependent transcriptional regulator [Candidatus Binatia bacterium]|nr:sigma-54 dependent transcriptional regulator [Candidatus Binatia bacterium]